MRGFSGNNVVLYEGAVWESDLQEFTFWLEFDKCNLWCCFIHKHTDFSLRNKSLMDEVYLFFMEII